MALGDRPVVCQLVIDRLPSPKGRRTAPSRAAGPGGRTAHSERRPAASHASPKTLPPIAGYVRADAPFCVVSSSSKTRCSVSLETMPFRRTWYLWTDVEVVTQRSSSRSLGVSLATASWSTMWTASSGSPGAVNGRATNAPGMPTADPPSSRRPTWSNFAEVDVAIDFFVTSRSPVGR